MTTLLDVQGLSKSYPARRDALGRVVRRFQAVDDATFSLAAGETLAVVGESGAGKSTLGRMVLRLIEPDQGSIRLEGEDLRALGHGALRRRRAHMQMIFQDPYSSLDPKMTVGDSVGEPARIFLGQKGEQRDETVRELMRRVGMRDDQIDRYPHELSGGQLQRVAIAKALVPAPRLLVCDEPVAALDVSIRAQIINLLRDLQADRGLSYLFISHDLSLVRTIAHRVAVMYAGRIVEIGSSEEIFETPRHPYTRRLLAAIPEPDPRRRKLDHHRSTEVSVDKEHVIEWNARCAYLERCPLVVDTCSRVAPILVQVSQVEVRCHVEAPPPERAEVVGRGTEAPSATR